MVKLKCTSSAPNSEKQILSTRAVYESKDQMHSIEHPNSYLLKCLDNFKLYINTFGSSFPNIFDLLDAVIRFLSDNSICSNPIVVLENIINFISDIDSCTNEIYGILDPLEIDELNYTFNKIAKTGINWIISYFELNDREVPNILKVTLNQKKNKVLDIFEINLDNKQYVLNTIINQLDELDKNSLKNILIEWIETLVLHDIKYIILNSLLSNKLLHCYEIINKIDLSDSECNSTLLIISNEDDDILNQLGNKCINAELYNDRAYAKKNKIISTENENKLNVSDLHLSLLHDHKNQIETDNLCETIYLTQCSSADNKNAKDQTINEENKIKGHSVHCNDAFKLLSQDLPKTSYPEIKNPSKFYCRMNKESGFIKHNENKYAINKSVINNISESDKKLIADVNSNAVHNIPVKDPTPNLCITKSLKEVPRDTELKNFCKVSNDNEIDWKNKQENSKDENEKAEKPSKIESKNLSKEVVENYFASNPNVIRDEDIKMIKKNVTNYCKMVEEKETVNKIDKMNINHTLSQTLSIKSLNNFTGNKEVILNNSLKVIPKSHNIVESLKTDKSLFINSHNDHNINKFIPVLNIGEALVTVNLDADEIKPQVGIKSSISLENSLVSMMKYNIKMEPETTFSTNKKSESNLKLEINDTLLNSKIYARSMKVKSNRRSNRGLLTDEEKSKISKMLEKSKNNSTESQVINKSVITTKGETNKKCMRNISKKKFRLLELMSSENDDESETKIVESKEIKKSVKQSSDIEKVSEKSKSLIKSIEEVSEESKDCSSKITALEEILLSQECTKSLDDDWLMSLIQ